MMYNEYVQNIYVYMNIKYTESLKLNRAVRFSVLWSCYMNQTFIPWFWLFTITDISITYIELYVYKYYKRTSLNVICTRF